MLDRYLIEHCSPTLASLKTASLFTYRFEDDLDSTVAAWNAQFAVKGISLLVLRRRENTALIYVFRHKKLAADLKRPGVDALLRENGYTELSVSGALEHLRVRLAENEAFPHEIGVFLGYPVEDVIGFIENAGQNCKCCGCWKVYCNECEAIRTFARFKKCREVYLRLWNEGRSILQLTVAAGQIIL